MTDKGSRGVHDTSDRYPQYGSGNDQKQPGGGKEGDSRGEPAGHLGMIGLRPKAQGLRAGPGIRRLVLLLGGQKARAKVGIREKGKERGAKSAGAFEQRDQAMNHSTHFLSVGDQYRGFRLADDLNPGSDDELSLKFRTRRMRRPQMLNVRSR